MPPYVAVQVAMTGAQTRWFPVREGLRQELSSLPGRWPSDVSLWRG